jgi:hypothetical protein
MPVFQSVLRLPFNTVRQVYAVHRFQIGGTR